MFTKRLTRFSAFGTHLLTSLAIFATLTAILLLSWFPAPFFETDGGWEGLRIVAFVDVVLGPLLTLIVFKPGKPGLKMDMALIITLQLCALAWGIWTLHSQRPALLAYADDSMQAIPLSVVRELDPSGVVLKRFADHLPAKVVVRIPQEPIARAAFLVEKARAGRPLHQSFEDYAPLAEHWPEVVNDSLDIRHYTSAMPEWAAKVQQKTAELGKDIDQLVFLPVVGTKKSVILVADRESGEFLDSVDIRYDAARATKLLPLSQRLEAETAR